MEIQWMSCYVQWIQSIYILHSFVWHTPEEKSLFHRSFVSWARNIFSVSSNLSSFASSVCYVLYISLFFFHFWSSCHDFEIYMSMSESFNSSLIFIYNRIEDCLAMSAWLWCIRKWVKSLYVYHSITIPKSNIDLHKSCTLHTPKLFFLR